MYISVGKVVYANVMRRNERGEERSCDLWGEFNELLYCIMLQDKTRWDETRRDKMRRRDET